MADLNMSAAQLARDGGPSDTTLTRVLAGNPPAPRSDTLERLDRGLRWEPGSAKRVLKGGGPTPEPFFRSMRTEEELGEAITTAQHRSVARLQEAGGGDEAVEQAIDMHLELFNLVLAALELGRLGVAMGASSSEVERLVNSAMAVYVETGTMAITTRGIPEMAVRASERWVEILKLAKGTSSTSRGVVDHDRGQEPQQDEGRPASSSEGGRSGGRGAPIGGAGDDTGYPERPPIPGRISIDTPREGESPRKLS